MGTSSIGQLSPQILFRLVATGPDGYSTPNDVVVRKRSSLGTHVILTLLTVNMLCGCPGTCSSRDDTRRERQRRP